MTRLWKHPAIDGKHIVSMRREQRDAGPFSVALCQCGWISRVKLGAGEHASAMVEQNGAVEGHWRAMIGEATDSAA